MTLLPDDITLRASQLQAREDITAAFDRLGAHCDDDRPRVVFWEAPTGTGKTHGAVAIADALSEDRALYVCSGIQLQEQFARDYPEAAVLKGRSNYVPTVAMPGITCADCNKTGRGEQAKCSYCPDIALCPYRVVKIAAVRGHLAVINTTYFLTEANGPGAFSGNYPFVILDEADELESELMRFMEFKVAQSTMRELDITPPKKGIHRKTMAAWLEELAEAAVDEGRSIKVEVAGEEDPELVKIRDKWLMLGGRAKYMAGEVVDENWIRTYQEEGWGKDRSEPLLYKPVEVDKRAPKLLWEHGQRWLCMSATIISAEQMARELGLERDQWEFVASGSDFPAERRPTYVTGVAAMTKKKMEVSLPAMVEGVSRLVDHHPGENVLVHTHTFKIAGALAEEMSPADGRKVFSYASSRDREATVEAFREEGGVLLAASLERGVDLPDDMCSVIMIVKVPYPYMGDRQVAERMSREHGQTWYEVQTIRALVQMTGRGMRHRMDRCVSYVLDGQFNMGVWRGRRELFPAWWREAVQMVRVNKVLSGEIAEGWQARRHGKKKP